MQNIMHNYANRLESGGAIDHFPASEASPSYRPPSGERSEPIGHLPASEASPMLQRDCERSEHVASIHIISKFNMYIYI